MRRKKIDKERKNKKREMDRYMNGWRERDQRNKKDGDK